MKWDNLTIKDFQDLTLIGSNSTLEEIDRACQVVAIVYNISVDAVEDLPLDRMLSLSRECIDLIKSTIPNSTPPRYIEVPAKSSINGSLKPRPQSYTLDLKLTHLRHKQYRELVTYCESPIKNLHLILAQLVKPGVTLIGRQKKIDRNQLAEDILQSKFIDAYAVCLYFQKLLNNTLIELTK